ncbi:MAG: hypothetical protein MRZ75_08255 [Roseburia sp.]|nr:hypothetical protein [Roseburia sp.]MDY5883609.1 hypothetical protein [Roseburia sp.]
MTELDKYEYKLKLDQMKSLAAEGDYTTAAEIADSINWRKIKNVTALVKAGEIYEQTGRYEESKELLLQAYDRSPIGRMIVYRLAEVAIKMKDFGEAKDYYDEFVEIAPHDSLKYILRYDMSKAKGEDNKAQIAILEELKEQEYTEEWAYELAYLYHKEGMSEKCIAACDELILWFGDGPYVERALELKMLYQPLTKQQEEKYRMFRQKHAGITEVRPEDRLESGEIVNQPVQIPQVKVNAERFNTVNLQEELAKSMQQIMDATEKDDVDNTMDNIKKIAEEIPYLQIPHKEEGEEEERFGHIETDEEIDDSLKTNFQEMLAEENDGQMSLYVPEKTAAERQITGQLDIDDILAEWGKTMRAAEVSLEDANQRKLASAKARALQEAGDIMERLVDVIPKLDSGLTPKELLEQEYLKDSVHTMKDTAGAADAASKASAWVAPQIQDMPVEAAGKLVENMNNILQREIDRVSAENSHIDAQLAAAGALTEEEFRALTQGLDMQEHPEVAENQEQEYSETTENLEQNYPEYQETEFSGEEPEFDDWEEPAQEEVLPEVELPEDLVVSVEDVAGDNTEVMPEAETAFQEAALEEEFPQDELEQNSEEELSQIEFEQDAEEGELPQIEIEQDAEEEEELPQIEIEEQEFEEQETDGEELPVIEEPELTEEEEKEPRTITKLSEEEEEIFSYFVPITGMKEQICQAMTGIIRHLESNENSGCGNLIIQGGRGCGKTVLATDVVKAIQKETGKPNGKIGKIEGAVLNQKDIVQLLKKISGGCLIIEKAGEISRETAVKLSLLMEAETSGLLIILEDTSRGIQKALGKDQGFASKFTEKLNIPIFTSDELVSFARTYANELGYNIDEMAVLALYNRISNIQKLDQATTLTEVKEIVDEAIARAEKGGIKKAFSILTARRYDENDNVILHEKDFDE